MLGPTTDNRVGVAVKKAIEELNPAIDSKIGDALQDAATDNKIEILLPVNADLLEDLDNEEVAETESLRRDRLWCLTILNLVSTRHVFGSVVTGVSCILVPKRLRCGSRRLSCDTEVAHWCDHLCEPCSHHVVLKTSEHRRIVYIWLQLCGNANYDD